MSVFARVCVHHPFTQCYFQTTALVDQPFLTATGCGSHDEFMSTPLLSPCALWETLALLTLSQLSTHIL